jgi:F-type H+-transporting ATPase subunit gamma
LKEKPEAGLNSPHRLRPQGPELDPQEQAVLTDEHIGVLGPYQFNEASAAYKLVQGYLDGSMTSFHPLPSSQHGQQLPVLKKLLPIPPIAKAEAEEKTQAAYLPEHICEPSAAELLGEMLPRNVYVQLYSALLETSACEHAARMMAMDNATKACNDMIGNLTLAY